LEGMGWNEKLKAAAVVFSRGNYLGVQWNPLLLITANKALLKKTKKNGVTHGLEERKEMNIIHTSEP